MRGGDLSSKNGPAARAKSDVNCNEKSRRLTSIFLLGTNAFGFEASGASGIYCRYHENGSLLCKTNIKLSSSNPFQKDDNNDQPPYETPKSNLEEFKYGLNPFISKFDYNNPSHTRENIDFNNEKHIFHIYDKHARKCFSMTENRNKQSLNKFIGKTCEFIQSLDTQKSNSFYRYETPAYFYKQKDRNLVAIVSAINNSLIIIVNATKSQLKNMQQNHNFGLDTRPSMQLRLRGPKNNN